jgi:SAM-dependent methyltransferase
MELPFEDASFDVVTNFQVLEHVPDAIAYLEGLRRVTRPGGLVILATPNASTRLDPGMTPWNRFHVREYTAAELRELLERMFPRVRIRGMFGTATLYETEIRRVDAARQRMRRLAAAEAARAAPPPAAARAPSARRSQGSVARRVARKLIPATARRWVRQLAAPDPARVPRVQTGPPEHALATAEMPLEAFLQFTVDDLFYADHDLDRAMDLLAICQVGPAR